MLVAWGCNPRFVMVHMDTAKVSPWLWSTRDVTWHLALLTVTLRIPVRQCVAWPALTHNRTVWDTAHVHYQLGPLRIEEQSCP